MSVSLVITAPIEFDLHSTNTFVLKYFTFVIFEVTNLLVSCSKFNSKDKIIDALFYKKYQLANIIQL